MAGSRAGERAGLGADPTERAPGSAPPPASDTPERRDPWHDLAELAARLRATPDDHLGAAMDGVLSFTGAHAAWVVVLDDDAADLVPAHLAAARGASALDVLASRPDRALPAGADDVVRRVVAARAMVSDQRRAEPLTGLALLARGRLGGVLLLAAPDPVVDPVALALLADQVALAVELDGAARKVRAASRRTRASLEAMVDAVAVLAPVAEGGLPVSDFTYVYLNGAYRELFGETVGERVSVRALRLGAPQLLARYLKVFTSGEPALVDGVRIVLDRAKGIDAYVDIRVVKVGGELLLSIRDVSDRVRAERELARSEQRFRSAFHDAPVGMLLIDLHPDRFGRLVLANAAISALTGYAAGELAAMSQSELSHPADRVDDDLILEEFAAGMRRHYQREKRWIRADGRQIWVRVSAAALTEEDSLRFCLAHVEDVTERKRAESELAQQALFDPLTGLPNRHLVMDRLRHAVARMGRERGAQVAVLYLDLDRFKDINDTYGHEAGDAVLVETADRLRRAVRRPDTPARLGGDEFVVVCTQIRTTSEVARVADRLVAAMAAPIALPGILPATEVTVGASFGGALSGDPTIEPEQLLRQADLAMYEAKRRGRGRFEFYRQGMETVAVRRLAIEEQLREAIREGWLVLHYQPVVDLISGEIVATEALLRIQHPQQGLIGPTAFIDVAEDSDLILEIGSWVIAQACRQLARWRPVHPLEMAVNVSGRQASHLTVTDDVLSAAGSAGIDPSWLCLEMTERVLIHATEVVLGDLAALTDAGVKVAIDDFGTGYASLSYLQRLPVGVVKIDRSFVAGLGAGGRETEIVAAVIALGSALHLRVVAEGVETAMQRDELVRLGCRFGQGFHFCRPVTAETIDELLAAGAHVVRA